MEIRYLKKADPESIDRFLREERKKRVEAANRNLLEDFVIVYEPTEAFSIQKETDLRSIRSEKEFRAYVETKHVPVVVTKRGGGIIWHGPGQICLAPVIDVERLKISLILYCKILEETCIQTLARFGIEALRNDYLQGSQGAWIVEENGTKKKIAFYGAHARRGIVIHGCAINVSPDLYPFSLIDPCNLPGIDVTSIAELLDEIPVPDEVGKVLAETFARLILDPPKEKSA